MWQLTTNDSTSRINWNRLPSMTIAGNVAVIHAIHAQNKRVNFRGVVQTVNPKCLRRAELAPLLLIVIAKSQRSKLRSTGSIRHTGHSWHRLQLLLHCRHTGHSWPKKTPPEGGVCMGMVSLCCSDQRQIDGTYFVGMVVPAAVPQDHSRTSVVGPGVVGVSA